MAIAIEKTFESRSQAFGKEGKILKEQFTWYSWARVLTFFIAVILIVVFAGEKSTVGVLITIAAWAVSFLLLLKQHLRIKWKKRFAEELSIINAEELLRLKGELKSFGGGDAYFDPSHYYYIDLDIFGKNSLFQLLNRTSTSSGEKQLAQWMSKPSVKGEILLRHQAVQELAPKIDWRQNFEAYGRAYQEEKGDTKDLLGWLKEENTTLGNRLYHAAIFIFPLLTVSSIVFSSIGIISMGIPLLLIFVNLGVLATVFNRAKAVYQKTVTSSKILKAYEKMILLIEDEPFESELLQSLKHQFVHDHQKASTALKQLQFILDNLHNRANMVYHIFNMAFLLDVIWLIKAEQWKERVKQDIEMWFEAISSFECLNSIAGFHFANPDYAFPEISDESFTIESKNLGHPLIKATARICNDFHFSGKGGICLITGSNMSGKSTFLRTVGINTVLALMGAPVCATEMRVSRLLVFTSMRTQDDLEESVSSFYAELKRLKQLLQTINRETPVLFMIDEVLKGTNSKDRHKGAISLIKQLNKAYAFGFVSTHDLELGKITEELEGIKNYSFNSEIVEDEIIFDYKLTDGLCKSFNATKLMQKMGIEIID